MPTGPLLLCTSTYGCTLQLALCGGVCSFVVVVVVVVCIYICGWEGGCGCVCVQSVCVVGVVVWRYVVVHV